MNFMINKLMVVTLLIAALPAFSMETDEHTLFLAKFDAGPVADFSVGAPQPKGVAAFVEGKRGQALSSPLGLLPFAESVAPITTGVQYPSDGNINLEQGTIELWVRLYSEIVETTDKSPKLRYLMSSGKYTDGNHGFAIVLSHFEGKPGEPYVLTFTRGNGPDKARSWSVSCNPDWKPGEWHHVAVTYSPQGDALFVDGKLMGRTEATEGMDLIGEHFALGASIYHSYLGDCAIDEVRISENVRYTGDFEVK